jgi:hypothetical protein
MEREEGKEKKKGTMHGRRLKKGRTKTSRRDVAAAEAVAGDGASVAVHFGDAHRDEQGPGNEADGGMAAAVGAAAADIPNADSGPPLLGSHAAVAAAASEVDLA